MNEILKGVYKLKEFVMIFGKEKHYPAGKDAEGLLIYTDEYVSIQIYDIHRRKFKAGDCGTDQLKGTEKEVREAFEGTMAYFGKIKPRHRGEIIHRIDNSLFPNWSKTSQLRSYKKYKNSLTLITNAILGNKVGILLIKWRRVE